MKLNLARVSLMCAVDGDKVLLAGRTPDHQWCLELFSEAGVSLKICFLSNRPTGMASVNRQRTPCIALSFM